jgi:hypothetical protein
VDRRPFQIVELPADLVMLAGNYRYAAKIPVVPGYKSAGVVEAIGVGFAGFEVGYRLAALTVYGGLAERLVREDWPLAFDAEFPIIKGRRVLRCYNGGRCSSGS